MDSALIFQLLKKFLADSNKKNITFAADCKALPQRASFRMVSFYHGTMVKYILFYRNEFLKLCKKGKKRN